MEEILLKFLLADAIGGFVVEFGEHAHGAGVGLLGLLAFSIQLQGFDRVLLPILHDHTSPFLGVRV